MYTLFYSPASPYARKARMVVIEKGLGDRVAAVQRDPYADPDDLRTGNPLGKVPTLVRPGVAPLFDSPLVCEFLDSLPSDAAPLMPAGGEARWTVLRRQALADGMIDATYNLVMDRRRTDTRPSAHWEARWLDAIHRAVAVLAADPLALPPVDGSAPLDMGHIAVGSALGYLDLRLAGDVAWRNGHADLAARFTAFSRRPAMAQTMPPTG